MQDNKPKNKKGLKILVLIIVAYIVVVCGIALYVKLDKKTDMVSATGEIQNRVDVPKLTPKAVSKDIKPVAADGDNMTSSSPLAHIGELKEMDSEDDFDKAYAEYLGSSFADVPAKALEEKNSKNETDDEVLYVADLSLEVEKPKGFFERLIDSIYNLFNGGEIEQVKETSNEVVNMLAEIDGEIGEMQSQFSLYKESNGVTYIDHLNKPMVLESNGFYIYIGVAPNGFTFHRTIIRYSGPEEIDLQSILVQTTSNDRASIIDATEDVLQKRFTTVANEWVDLPPTQENNTLLNSVVSSDNVKITFMGANRNVDWTLTENEMITLKESLHFYNLLKEKEELSK